MSDDLLTVREIAERFGLTPQRIYVLSAKPEFPPAAKKSGSYRFWHPEDVAYWWRTRIDQRKFNGVKAREYWRKRRHK